MLPTSPAGQRYSSPAREGTRFYDRPIGASVGVTLSGGTLDLAGFSEGFDALTGSGTVTDSASGTTSTLTLGTFNGSGTFSGTIQNGSGTIALKKVGNGTLTLANSNSFSGGTTISAGVLQVGSGGADTVSTAGSGPITDKATLSFSSSSTLPAVTAAISGPGQLVKTGAGTVVIGGAADNPSILLDAEAGTVNQQCRREHDRGQQQQLRQ